jgi:hypothetical protein
MLILLYCARNDYDFLTPIIKSSISLRLSYILLILTTHYRYIGEGIHEPRHDKWVCDQQGSRPTCASVQSGRDPCCSLANSFTSRETDSEQHGVWSDWSASMLVANALRWFFHGAANILIFLVMFASIVVHQCMVKVIWNTWTCFHLYKFEIFIFCYAVYMSYKCS